MITLVNNNNIKLTIREDIINGLNFAEWQYKELFEYAEEAETIEEVQDIIQDNIYEYVENMQPIYNSDIMKHFSELDFTEIDELTEEGGIIEYDGNFYNFALSVLVQKDIQDMLQDLTIIYDLMEEEEHFTMEDFEEVKSDIINYLHVCCDATIEEQAQIYRKYGGLGAVEIINRYISEVIYCSYAVVGHGENLRDWEVFKFFESKLYNDKDIQREVESYMNY